MRLSISARFTLKDKLKDYKWLTSEHWNFGKDKPLSMSDLAIGFLQVLFRWHCTWLAAEKMNEEKRHIANWLAGVSFEEQPSRRPNCTCEATPCECPF